MKYFTKDSAKERKYTSPSLEVIALNREFIPIMATSGEPVPDEPEPGF